MTSLKPIILSVFLFISCNFDDTKTIYQILQNDLKIPAQTHQIYVIQNNSCMLCFENLKKLVENDKTKDRKFVIIYLHNKKNNKNINADFLNIDTNIKVYLTHNKKLKSLLLKATGGFSKGFFLIDGYSSGKVHVQAL